MFRVGDRVLIESVYWDDAFLSPRFVDFGILLEWVAGDPDAQIRYLSLQSRTECYALASQVVADRGYAIREIADLARDRALRVLRVIGTPLGAVVFVGLLVFALVLGGWTILLGYNLLVPWFPLWSEYTLGYGSFVPPSPWQYAVNLLGGLMAIAFGLAILTFGVMLPLSELRYRRRATRH